MILSDGPLRSHVFARALLDELRMIFLTMPPRARKLIAVFIAVFLLAATWLVFVTGGVKYAYLHLLYLPVIVAALAFEVPGGIVAGVAAGLLIGPYMPIDTNTWEMQQAVNWGYRMLAFALVGTVAGIGARVFRQHLNTLSWLHEHHPDSGLLNYAGMIRQLEKEFASLPSGEKLNASVVQLNNLLEVHNTFGLDFGNELLALVVQRARRIAPPGSLLAVIQPDRLVIVVRGDAAAHEAKIKAEAAILESYVVNGVPIHVSITIGTASYPLHAASPKELIQKASIAMHWATSAKVRIAGYDSRRDQTSRENLTLLGRLPDAIAAGELRMWYQAKIDLRSGEVAGAEALLRWQHPEYGLVPPGRFIPQLEETSLVNPVTRWVVEAAFADAAAWRSSGSRRLAVNLSTRNLRDRLLLDHLNECVAKNDLDPSEVELEITETAIMADPDFCIQLISQLRALGYRVSIDDFGIGHSSLAYLKSLPVSGLKIDQEFIKTLASDGNNRKIVRTILQLADSLGLETVAEGIEDLRAAELLREWGCSYGQGYALHRPVPAAEFQHWLDTRSGPAIRLTAAS